METFAESCPRNTTEVLESSIRLGCGQDKYGNNQYICVPNIDKTGLVELCYNGIMGIIERGNCVRTRDGRLYRTSCLDFTSGCPELEYKSNKIYLYPACQNINTQDRCYLAESSCPKTTLTLTTIGTTESSSPGLSTIPSIYNTTIINLFESTLPQKENDSTGVIVGSLVAVVFILILVLAGVLWKWKCKQKEKRQRYIPTDEQEMGKIKTQHQGGNDISTLPDCKHPLLTHTDTTDDTTNEQEPLVELELKEKLLEVTDAYVLRETIGFTDAAANIKPNEGDKDIAQICINTEPNEKFTDVKETDINTNLEERKRGVPKTGVNSKPEERKHDVTKAGVNSEQEEREYVVTETGVDSKKEDEREHGVTEVGLSTEEEEGVPRGTDAVVNSEPEERVRVLRRARVSVGELIKQTLQTLIPDKDGLKSPHRRDYNIWKTKISDKFSTLTDEEVSVLFCFLCSDSGPPDFTDTEWLDMLNKIRQEVYRKKNPVTSEEAQQTLDRLKSRDYLWEDQDKITEDTKDETMYKIASIDSDIPFYYSSYDTASVYLRSYRYNRKPGEKCVCGGYSDYLLSTDYSDYLLIRRLQMNILTHVTMEDTTIYDRIHQILNIPEHNVKSNRDERAEFLMKVRREGEAVHYRGRSQDSVDHVTWLWRYGRPNIVRSCIGLHPHWDIYIIDNKACNKPTKYHNFQPEVRCLLYCLLLTEKYQLNLNEQSHRITRDKIRDRYFTDVTGDGLVDLPDGITETHNGVTTFMSDDIRHDAMYAFVTECLVEDSDLEFFLTTASRDVISEYCRSWEYERSEGERCLYIPDEPEKMYDLFIDKLQLDIITHCTMSDDEIHDSISKRFRVPKEILQWDQKARERYVEYAKRGTRTVHHARGMIVGCAGAGKTTLLKRLLGCSEEVIKEVKSTEGLEVHEEIIDICDETRSLKGRTQGRDSFEKSGEENIGPSDKTLTFFDFGGQCAYYACHQIYLTRRAFYLIVVDASKRFDQVVDKEVCDQTDTVFSGWTYREYFVFWLKSIHTYCSSVKQGSDDKVEVLIVATHWDKTIYTNKENFLQSLYSVLPDNSQLPQYIREDRCFLAEFPPTQPIEDLERCIIDITLKSKWSEKIPHEWVFLNNEINDKNSNQPIIPLSDLSHRMPVQSYFKEQNAVDMLRYYHDAGKCIFFNERGLRDSVVLDVQWFINAFKTIITDKLHVRGIIANKNDWKDYYETGNLEDSLLNGIWKMEDDKIHTTLKTTDIDISERNYCVLFNAVERFDRSYLCQKASLLTYMMRLGLLAVGEKCHYVPCMNKKDFDTAQKSIVQRSMAKTSVMVFLFDFLPFFLFYRLVVALMQRKKLEVLRSKGSRCLYKNAAMFNFRNHYLVVAVTVDTIQLQIFRSEANGPLEKETTLGIKWVVDGILKDITNTFHKHLSYKTGFKCVKEQDQIIGIEIDDNFIEEGKLRKGTVMDCPLHQVEDHHTINPDYLTKFWK